MTKYKVLRGSHQVMSSKVPDDGGVPAITVVSYRAGDVFEVPDGGDYDKRLARMRIKRFVKVPNDTPVKNSLPLDLEEVTARQPAEAEPRVESLLVNQFLGATQGMTISDLKELAADNGVDLTGAVKRSDIIARLQAHAQA